MSVARSDESSSSPVARKRAPRKQVEGLPPPGAPVRLDDLYRLPMPKLFAFAEREGVAEHTGMNRGQLIAAVVRKEIERGEVVRGSGTLEVLPDGYGFLSQIVDSRVIRDAGNTNLGIVDPTIDAMVDQALVTGDAAGREKIWAGIDKQVMDDAFVIPGIWAKGLLYRPPTLTNVFVTDGFSMYDYAAMGTTRQ